VPLRIGMLLLAWAIAMVLWGMAHGTSNIERGVDIPIVFNGVSDDLVLIDQSARADNIRVLGSRAALRDARLERMEYRVDVSGAQRGEAVYDIDPGRIEEQLPAGARIVSRSPASLELKFARRARKSIRVRADIVGEPAEGYNVAWVEVDPPYVWLSGDRREVVSMREAITEPLEIRGASESLEREVRLALPDHVWMEEARPLKVRVQVDAIPKSRVRKR